MEALPPLLLLAFLFPLDAALDDEGGFLSILELDHGKGSGTKVDDLFSRAEVLGRGNALVHTFKVCWQTCFPIRTEGTRQIMDGFLADRAHGSVCSYLADEGLPAFAAHWLGSLSGILCLSRTLSKALSLTALALGSGLGFLGLATGASILGGPVVSSLRGLPQGSRVGRALPLLLSTG